MVKADILPLTVIIVAISTKR